LNDIDTRTVRGLLATLRDANIGPFIDLKKLCRSSFYERVVEIAVAKADEHGNLTQLNHFLEVLHGTPYANDLILVARLRLNVVVVDSMPVALRKATRAQIAQAARQALVKKPVTKVDVRTPVKKYEKEERSQDLMDSRLMLPGGYGTGRRR
jgi:hypothetical protein